MILFALLVYVCIGGFIVGIADPHDEATTDDVWATIGTCLMWLPVGFIILGQMVAQPAAKRKERG